VPPSSTNAAGLLAVVVQGECGTPRALVAELADGQRDVVHGDLALVAQHAVLERRVEIQRHPGADFQVELGAQQRGEGVHRRSAAGQPSEEDPRYRAGQRDRLGHIMIEAATGIAVGIRQRPRQLHAVQYRSCLAIGGDRHFRMVDSGAAGHQVELTRANRGVDARAVSVFDLAAEQPADGLQPGMWMRRNVHAGGSAEVVWTVMVAKTPRTDQCALPLRKRPTDPDRARAAHRDLPRFQHLQILEM
jgi:hypothetical protein